MIDHIGRGDALVYDVNRLIVAHTDSLPVADAQHVTLYALTRLLCQHTLAAMTPDATARDLVDALALGKGLDMLLACAELEVHRRRGEL